MNAQVAKRYLTAMLTSGKLKRLVIKTKNLTETFTPNKATTIDRIIPEVGEGPFVTFVSYLRQWDVQDADIEVDFTRTIGDLPFYITWRGGVWNRGVWVGGDWKTGVWNGGTWLNGIWHDGIWKGGVWENGVWNGGTWLGGIWKKGIYAPKGPRRP